MQTFLFQWTSLANLSNFNKIRKNSQPPAIYNAGSVFKNSSQYPAGYLIDNAGLKGLKSGDAQISTKHANFIINHGKAKASDILKVAKWLEESTK